MWTTSKDLSVWRICQWLRNPVGSKITWKHAMCPYGQLFENTCLEKGFWNHVLITWYLKVNEKHSVESVKNNVAKTIVWRCFAILRDAI